ncbi:dTDP-4-dehydrorhamnose reductase [Mesorhizobium sp. ZMM04-5]|uniref:dTDP-4-dehydrorhamnose reductase n=1 Tax=Mesorhizobium marinum TaxID=3228790 RepID=A0ABV3R0W9_9HYPH
MKILVTGSRGQLARSLAERAAGRPEMDVVLAGRPGLDLHDPASVRATIVAAKPDVVVSAAAYTAVDAAEDEPEAAFAVNAAGAAAVAAGAAEAGAAIVHLSTDYVFAGDQPGERVETDPPDPRNVYGMSKLAGERAVADVNPRHAILRTAWVYSPFGQNFATTMLGLAAGRDKVRVVADQWGNPTAAADLAEGVLRVASALAAGAPAASGTFHLAGHGSTNWAGFAREIFAQSSRLGGPSAEVEEVVSQDFPMRAYRPRNSRLSCAKFETTFGWRAPDWRDSCRAVVARMVAKEVPGPTR